MSTGWRSASSPAPPLINLYIRIVLWWRVKGLAARSSDMIGLLQRFGRSLEKMLEQLAVRTEDGRLIYQDILCMSWVDVCDGPAPGHQRDSMKNDGSKEI